MICNITCGFLKMEKSKFNLILASASPRRKELIGHLNVPYKILTLNVPEESSATDPVIFSSEIASLKGEAVADELLAKNDSINYFIVSADTIVSLDNVIYGKPKDRKDAQKILEKLSGRTHSVFTAVSMRLIENGTVLSHSFIEESKVTFNQITPELMERYLSTGDSLDKAGAYGIQGPSLTFISKVEGDYANVVGFPLSRFVKEVSKIFKNKYGSEVSWFDYF